MEKLRFPIGPFERPVSYSEKDLQAWIADIEAFPVQMQSFFDGIAQSSWDTPYRPEGWTLRQLVHHCADSHLNSYTRFKLAMTEDRPTIRPYSEEIWAELPDSLQMPPQVSLDLLKSLHARWVFLLKNMTASDFEKEFVHPSSPAPYKLWAAAAMYSWHCRHHLEHALRTPLL